MAEKATGNEKKVKEKAPGPGHNRADLTKKLASCVKEVIGFQDKRAEAVGSFNLSIGHRIDKAAEETGFPKALIRKEIARITRQMNEEERESEMSEEERDETERCRQLLGETPFGKYVETKLAAA